uniref:Hemerythrin-like domain-containing protein n=1 Tax=Spumella elongata TaxID=89044 RepID=A0A7S3GUK7_9STRA|mmetsp:Transcript_2038/g.3393  ORF Transcript_2038/g.3393 Transcript_2038/m.3393 type:complete len:217 (+) Transcript_2038:2-652(+)
MTLLIEHLGDRELEAWEVHAMRSIWDCHYEHVHDHHTNEDGIMTPSMATRINLPAKLTTDHEGLVARMEVLKVIVSSLTNAAQLDLAWSEYQMYMLPHLFEEEQISLPLLRAFFTPAEAGAIVGKILGAGKPAVLGSFFYWFGSADPNAADTASVTDASIKAATTAFMAQEGIPWFVWHIEFKGYIQAYRDAMVINAAALFRGVPPSTQAPWFGCC